MTHPKADGLDALKREVSMIDEYTDGGVYMCSTNNPYDLGWNAAIDHLAQRGLIVRDGWVAVPMEPTEEMCKAGWEQHREDFHCNGKYDAANHYRAMLAAAPKMEEQHDR